MKVLVVEDDRAVAHALQQLLSSYHYAVDVAADGEAGLKMVGAVNYDLIMLDVILPQQDGMSVCRQLRSQGLQVPILLLTGQDGGQQKARAFTFGADDYIVKPFDAEDLMARVQTLLRREYSRPEDHELRATRAELQRQTERLHQVEQTLERERQNYRELQYRDHQWQALFDQALDAIAILDDEGRYVEVNPAACNLFGVTRQEMRQHTVADFSNPEADFEGIWHTFMQQGHLSGDFCVHRLDGSVRQTEFSAIANFVPGRHLSILRDIGDRKQLEAERKQSERQRHQLWEREHLIAEITRSIRQTLNLDEILTSAVDQVRQLLHTDRVIIFQLQPNCQGIVAAESVGGDWTAILSTTIRDPCFSESYTDLYRQGRVTAVADVQAAGIDPCYLDLLSTFEVRANLVVPILQEENLWGLLIAHHCSEPRQWKSDNVQLLQQVAAQLGIAIQQAELYQQAQRELLERRQIQTALEESEQRFRSLTAFAPVGIYEADTEGRYVYTNTRWQDIAGLTLEESLGQGWERGVHPQDRSRVVTAWNRFIYEHRTFSLEFRFLTPRGEIRWVYGRATAIYSTAGQIAGYVGVNEDITERKRAEAALRESESRFRQMTDAAPIMVWMADTNQGCTYFNQPWLNFTGRTLEEEVGNGWTERIHPSDYSFCIGAYDRAFNTRQSFEIEYRLRRFDGEYRWLLDTGTPRYDASGNFLGYIGSCLDISDRKRAEQKIREQAALIDIATDAIFVRDLEDRIVFWSQGAERLYGWTAEEALGQVAHELFGRGPRSTIEEILRVVTAEGVWRGELAQTTQSGRQILVESRWTLMRDPAGHPQSLLVVNTDITEKKQLESQFYQTQRLESLGRLASGIAHDLNNVLTPILAIAQLLRLTQQGLDAQTKDHLELVERSAKRGASMVKQILTFARGSYDDPTAVELPPLLQDVVNMAQQSFPKSIEIRSEFPDPNARNPSLSPVLADPTQLHQVFMNLCINARDAMPDGGVLTVSAQRVDVDQAFARTSLDVEVGPYVKVTVADTGTGIAPEVRDRMFEPFFTTKEVGQGTGLGLATTLGIVKNYGGFLQVLSEVGQGTEIEVYLPATTAVDADEGPQPETTDGTGQGILIVDDDSVVQRSAQSVLESCGYRTLTAADGEEAIACYSARCDDIQLVILDMMMPKLDGIALITRLKQLNPEVAIIATSGLATNRETALAAGANVFLTKPYTLEDFVGQVSALVRD